MKFLQFIHRSPLKEILLILGTIGSIASIIGLRSCFSEDSNKTVLHEAISQRVTITSSRGKSDLYLNFKEFSKLIKKNENLFAQKQKILEESKEKAVEWIGYVINIDKSENNEVYVTIESEKSSGSIAFFIFLSGYKEVALSLRGGDKVSCEGTIKKYYMDYPILVGHSLAIIN